MTDKIEVKIKKAVSKKGTEDTEKKRVQLIQETAKKEKYIDR